MTVISRDEWRRTATWAAILVVMVSLPYLIVYVAAPRDLVYTGFLTNPQDGNTYLAKMQQGLRGEWLLHLPYTPEPHQGEFLIVYYLALGHAARWLHLPLILVYHLARVINGLFLLLVLYYTIAWFFHDTFCRRFAFAITALGSGFGWLAALAGGMTVDLWVPEGYVLYSLFVNPHFPLAMSLMLLAITWAVTPWGVTRIDWRRLIGLALCAAGLGIVLPFCLVPIGAALLVYALVLWVQRRKTPWREIVSGAAIGVGGFPLVISAYLASTRNPVFAAWSAQNQTPSPPPWDYAVGYGVILVLALVGTWVAIQRRRDSDWLLLVWVAITVLLVYVPWSLQRRLVTGLVVPLGVLAAAGWYALPSQRRPRAAVVWGLAGLTHLFLIGVSLFGAFTRTEVLFLTRDEHGALDWLAAHAEPEALVIAAPETGLYIPAWAGQRVLYGHRFETVNAEARRAQLIGFFAGSGRELPSGPLRASYVFYGPRERALDEGEWQPDPSWKPVYQQGAVTLYALAGE